MGHSDTGAWGAGDTISAAGGVIYLILGWYLLPARRTFEGLAVFLATGVSLAPLILILIDPLVQFIYAHVLGVEHSPHLIEIVLTEARITLWWASFMAAAYLVKDLFEGPTIRDVGN